MSDITIDPFLFKTGMRKLAAAVNIVTTGGTKGSGGFTATAVCSVSDRPPTLLVCANGENENNALIKANRCLAVNVLGENQEWLANRFAGFGGVKGEERFLEGEWGAHQSGVPYLKNALVSFICKVTDLKEVATHTVFFGEVVEVIATERTDGLLYFNGAYQKLAALAEAQ